MEGLTRAQLIRALQAELRCVQEYTQLTEGCMPEALWRMVRQHAEVARKLSQQLWQAYGISPFYPIEMQKGGVIR